MEKTPEKGRVQSRRSFVKTAAWVAPAILSLKVKPAFAQHGSTRPGGNENTGGNQNTGGSGNTGTGGYPYNGYNNHTFANRLRNLLRYLLSLFGG